MTTTVMNVVLMGDDGVDDVADFCCSFAWATCVVRFAAARRGTQPTTSRSTMGALAVPGACVRTSPILAWESRWQCLASTSTLRPASVETTGCLWRAVPLAQQGHCCQMHWQRLVPCWPALAAPT